MELSCGVPGVFRVERDEGTCKAFLWDFKKLFSEEFTEQEVLKRAKVRRFGGFFDNCMLKDSVYSRTATVASNMI